MNKKGEDVIKLCVCGDLEDIPHKHSDGRIVKEYNISSLPITGEDNKQ